jgi:hypothetical protein
MEQALLFFRILGSGCGGAFAGSPIPRSRLLLSVTGIHSFGNDKTLNPRKAALTYPVFPPLYHSFEGSTASAFYKQ